MMRAAFPLAWLLMAPLCLLAAAHAGPARAAKAGVDEAWGIVTSQAVTVAGHEFSRYFIARWSDKPGSGRYTIAIHERPSARWGSQVWVEFGQRRVYQAQLPPARAQLQALGESAADNVYQGIVEIERQRPFIHDADLAPDEF